jgi:hypothetical protein
MNSFKNTHQVRRRRTTLQCPVEYITVVLITDMVGALPHLQNADTSWHEGMPPWLVG